MIYCVPLILAEALCSKRSYKKRLGLALTRKNILLMSAAPAFLLFFSFGLLFGSENLI